MKSASEHARILVAPDDVVIAGGPLVTANGGGGGTLERRLSLVAAAAAFALVSAAGVAVADPGTGTPLAPTSADVASDPGDIAVSRPAAEDLPPFESPGIAFAGMGRPARAASRPVPTDSGVGKRIVYAVSAQRVWLVEDDGTVLDTYLVSGRRGTPRPGTYRVYSKSLRTVAVHDGITMRYMVRFARASSGVPIGFHDLPRYRNGRPMQTTRQLGTYQSGGCVRQGRAQAIQLYEWAPIGTKVVVLR